MASAIDSLPTIRSCQAVSQTKLTTARWGPDRKLTKRYANVAKHAHIIVGASAKAGIKQLVYALAGYNPSAEEIIAAFKFYVREEARDYEREFPNQLYQEWYRLYQLPEPERNKPWKFKHLTVNHVYWPLANSKDHILESTKAQCAGSGSERRKRLHQFLSDTGIKHSASTSASFSVSLKYREIRSSTKGTSKGFSANNLKWIYERGRQLSRPYSSQVRSPQSHSNMRMVSSVSG